MSPTVPERLITSPASADPQGVVLMLHGGAEHGQNPVDSRSLAYKRTRAMFRSIAPTLNDAGFVVALLRFTVKGWNAGAGHEPSPVGDARAAIEELRQAHPDLPIVLLGHSMGARTAAAVADSDGVVGVVGLAPWFPADEPVRALSGKHLVAAHGSRDKITSAKASRIFVKRAAEVAQDARFLDMGPLGHYMLTRIRRWNEVAVTESTAILTTCAASRRETETG